MDFDILPRVNQVIYSLDTICDPNSTTLHVAQAVLEINLFIEKKLKREIIQ